jgi:hypothetical protein
MSFVSDLDTRLLQLSSKDFFTLRDAPNGVAIWGAIGSGKTSGSGAALAAAYLRAGMGGLILCAKPEEVTLWLSYAKKHGRSQSVVVFDASRGFNFLAYEIARQGIKGLGNITECLMRVLDASDMAMGAGGQSNEPFWDQSVRQRLNYSVPLLYAAHGNVTVTSIIDFITSAATKGEQYVDPSFAGRSFAAQTLRRAVDAPRLHMSEAEMKPLLEYWFHQVPAEPERTRGNVVMSVSARLDRFKHGRMRSCFCEHTDIVPEMTLHGALIIMAMPALSWNEDGIIGQQLFKFMWQRAVESRNSLSPEHQRRPVFLWADECQYFINLKDEEFLSTCRGSRACVVFLSQNLPTYLARFQGRESAADALIGKFNTQIFHANACAKTNQYASQLIGRGMQYRRTEGRSTGTSFSGGMSEGVSANRGYSASSGSSYSPGGGGYNTSSGNNSGSGENYGTNVGRGTNTGRNYSVAENMDVIVEPRFFATALKTGGPANNHEVSALWFKSSGNFAAANGGNVILTTFKQRKP